MQRKEINDKVRALLAEELQLNVNQVLDLSGPRTIAGWTSLTHVRIIIAVEEYFSIRFSNSELVELISVKRISDALALKLADT